MLTDDQSGLILFTLAPLHSYSFIVYLRENTLTRKLLLHLSQRELLLKGLR